MIDFCFEILCLLLIKGLRKNKERNKEKKKERINLHV